MGKINFFIYYEVDGDTSKHSLQSSTYFKVWPGPRVGVRFSHPLSIRDTGVCLGFLGSSGGHAAVSYFVCAKPTALGGVS